MTYAISTAFVLGLQAEYFNRFFTSPRDKTVPLMQWRASGN